MTRVLAFLAAAARELALLPMLAAIHAYRRWGSPMLGPRCRFRPTCSQYAATALRRYGPVRGGLKAAWRVLRCHPWSSGGFDPP